MSLSIHELSAGQEIGSRTIEVTRTDLVKYAGASGDFNPIHWNQDFAQGVGISNVIAHGMFTMGAAVALAACAVGPDYQAPVTALANVSTGAEGRTDITFTLPKADGERAVAALNAGNAAVTRMIARQDRAARKSRNLHVGLATCETEILEALAPHAGDGNQ